MADETHLNNSDPIPVEDPFTHELLHFLTQRRVHERRLTRNLRHQRIALLLVRALLEEHLRRLRQDDPDEELDHLPAEVERRRVQEVVVDVREHPRCRPEVVERALEPLGVGAVLGGRDGGVCRRDLEDDGRLLVRDRRLCDELVRERVAPGEVDADLGEA